MALHPRVVRTAAGCAGRSACADDLELSPRRRLLGPPDRPSRAEACPGRCHGHVRHRIDRHGHQPWLVVPASWHDDRRTGWGFYRRGPERLRGHERGAGWRSSSSTMPVSGWHGKPPPATSNARPSGRWTSVLAGRSPRQAVAASARRLARAWSTSVRWRFRRRRCFGVTSSSSSSIRKSSDIRSDAANGSLIRLGP